MKRYKSLFEIRNKINFNLKSTGRYDWDKEILEDKKRFHIEIKYMSPDEFLEISDYKRYAINKNNIEKIKNKILVSNKTVLPTPTLIFEDEYSYKKGFKSDWHDGTHRVLALKELNIDKIPVLIVYEKI